MEIVAVFLLGYYSVGAGNIFDNVHHRIGLTIFIAILLVRHMPFTTKVHDRFTDPLFQSHPPFPPQQFFLGLLNALVLSKPHIRTPIQNRLHIVLGWLIYGLGLAQIPVGMILYGSPRWAFGLYGAAAGLVVLTLLAFEVRIGRREDHNVDPRQYSTMTEVPAEAGGVGNSRIVPAYREVNWNGEIVGEKRKMMGFGRKI